MPKTNCWIQIAVLFSNFYRFFCRYGRVCYHSWKFFPSVWPLMLPCFQYTISRQCFRTNHDGLPENPIQHPCTLNWQTVLCDCTIWNYRINIVRTCQVFLHELLCSVIPSTRARDFTVWRTLLLMPIVSYRPSVHRVKCFLIKFLTTLDRVTSWTSSFNLASDLELLLWQALSFFVCY